MPFKYTDISFYTFTHIALPRYNKHLKQVFVFYIISDTNDYNRLKPFLELYPSIPFQHVHDVVLLYNVYNSSIKGWYKQQLIKLCISRLVETPYYLVVDADMYLNFDLVLTEGNRILYHSEPWQTSNNELYSTNSNWWNSSLKLLQLNIDITSDTALMSVTPQVLVTEYVKDLLKYLKELYGVNWMVMLCNGEFTEFTLYWLYLKSINKTGIYCKSKDRQLWAHDIKRNILTYMSESEQLEALTSPRETCFTVVQSYLEPNKNVLSCIK